MGGGRTLAWRPKSKNSRYCIPEHQELLCVQVCRQGQEHRNKEKHNDVMLANWEETCCIWKVCVFQRLTEQLGTEKGTADQLKQGRA